MPGDLGLAVGVEEGEGEEEAEEEEEAPPPPPELLVSQAAFFIEGREAGAGESWKEDQA